MWQGTACEEPVNLLQYGTLNDQHCQWLVVVPYFMYLLITLSHERHRSGSTPQMARY